MIAVKLKTKGIADGINILHASGKSAQQSVPHFHIHLFPRKEGDGIEAWPDTKYVEKVPPWETKHKLYNKIIDALSD